MVELFSRSKTERVKQQPFWYERFRSIPSQNSNTNQKESSGEDPKTSTSKKSLEEKIINSHFAPATRVTPSRRDAVPTAGLRQRERSGCAYGRQSQRQRRHSRRFRASRQFKYTIA
jgi:hypothetical protein